MENTNQPCGQALYIFIFRLITMKSTLIILWFVEVVVVNIVVVVLNIVAVHIVFSCGQ